MENDLVGITDTGISGNAPGFVANYTGAVNARGGFALLVAVEDWRTLDQHD